jgi:hypothetical protein
VLRRQRELASERDPFASADAWDARIEGGTGLVDGAGPAEEVPDSWDD